MKYVEIENNVEISKLKLNNLPLRNAEVAFESKCGVYRLYVNKKPKEEIFSFVGLRQITAFDDQWDNEKTTCDVLFHGIGVFDGVRHLLLSDYMGHVCLDSLSKMLAKTREIEKEICSLAD